MESDAANRSVTPYSTSSRALMVTLGPVGRKNPSLRRWPVLSTYCQANVTAPNPLGGVKACAATGEGGADANPATVATANASLGLWFTVRGYARGWVLRTFR